MRKVFLVICLVSMGTLAWAQTAPPLGSATLNGAVQSEVRAVWYSSNATGSQSPRALPAVLFQRNSGADCSSRRQADKRACLSG